MDASGKRHVLIVDDDIAIHIPFTPNERGERTSDMLSHFGADVETALATNPDEAIEQLKKWAARGITADVVTVDRVFLNSPNGEWNGSRLMDHILYGDAVPAEFKPKKLFFHTKGNEGPALPRQESVESHETVELELIAAYARGDYSQKFQRATLRSYLNEAFGLNPPIPTKDYQLELLRGKQVRWTAPAICEEVRLRRLTPEEALRKINPIDLVQFFTPRAVQQRYGGRRFSEGVGGDVTGYAAFTAEDVKRLRAEKKPPILIIESFSPEDMHVLDDVAGVVMLGNDTAHLRMILEDMGIPGLLGSQSGLSLRADGGNTVLTAKNSRDFIIRSGSQITLAERHLVDKALPIKLPTLEENPDYAQILAWAEKARKDQSGLNVKANAFTPAQVKQAIHQGAEGIGLLRTEHMFFDDKRLPVLQNLLLVPQLGKRNDVVSSLKKFQTKDFEDVFRAAMEVGKAGEFPIAIRFLDAPAKEFLADLIQPGPQAEKRVALLSATTGIPASEIIARCHDLIREDKRGVQLALAQDAAAPLYRMQAEAVFEAARNVQYTGKPELMVPLVRTPQELGAIKKIVDEVAAAHGYKRGEYRFGAMIETEAAVKNIEGIASQCDFLSIGSNDLTSEVLGLERGNIRDAREWMESCSSKSNPFLTLVPEVKNAIKAAVQKARAVNPGIDIGICGRQVSADIESIRWCHQAGLSSISTSVEHLAPSRFIAGQATLLDAPEIGPRAGISKGAIRPVNVRQAQPRAR